ncbi:MAG: efflux RND transporter periplasmic adaptor subunit [Bacteroidota bacterium]
MSLQRITIILSMLTILGGAVACQKASGGAERGQEIVLNRKKQELADKKQQLLSLNLEIAQLQAELEELDPTLAQKIRQAPVIVSPLEARDFQHFVQVQGKIEADKNILVTPQMSGRLTNLNVREGQRVKAGQSLGRLDASIMEATIAEINTSLDLAKVMFEKQENLWKQEIGTEVQYLTAKNQVESLEKRLATLDEQLALHVIRAPISGTVDEILPKVGEMVSPAMPAFRIVNNSNLSLVADLSESYAPKIKTGDVVKVNFPALDQAIDGKVSVVGQSIDPNDRTFRVEVKLPNNSSYKPNMFGQLAINDETRESAVVIPFEVVQHSEEGPFVFVAKAEGERMVAERRMLELGLSSEDEIEVVSGLSSGDQLITSGHKDLSDGQEILIQGQESASVAAAQ